MMRALVMIGVVMFAQAARAEPVNLLTAVPAVVAVSSTVENPAILPAHLVDGKLDTAWNSITGELEGAWIAARIPKDAHVDSIKLTAGFTKVDKKWGDLFTMNPRIKRVRVTRDFQIVGERTLDPALRTLQEIRIDGPGGDFRVTVLEVVPGTRKDWREVNISELEVWGTPGKSTPPVAKPLAPVIHVGGFDHDDLTRLQCAAALGVKATASYATDDFAGDLSICRIDQPVEHAVNGPVVKDTGTVVLGIVKRGAKPVRVAKLPAFATESTTGGLQNTGQPDTATTIAQRALPLSTTETALEVTTHKTEQAMQYSVDDTTVELFRIDAARGTATKILAYAFSKGGSTNGGDTSECKLDEPTPAAKLPATLDVRCARHHERYGGNGPDDQNRDTETVDHYTWNGKTYVAAP